MDNRSLFFVILAFADPDGAGDHMEGHNAWIDQGFDDDVFLMTGTVPGRGGAVLATNSNAAELAERVEKDPFVQHGVVTEEIIDITPSRVHKDLERLLGDRGAPST